MSTSYTATTFIEVDPDRVFEYVCAWRTISLLGLSTSCARLTRFRMDAM